MNKSGWPWTGESEQLPEVMSDGRPWPKISIVTPNYNYSRFIEATIRSVLLQGYPNLEYIIIDGGSSDDSLEIIKKYERWLTYWVSEKDKGQSQAINKGFAKASGDIFAWLNSDDRYLPRTFRIIAETAMANLQTGAFVGKSQRITVKGKIISEKQVPGLSFEEILNWGPYLAQPSCFFRRQTWQQCGPLDENLHFQMDFDLWLKIAKKASFIELSEVLSQELFHKAQKQVDPQFKAHQWAERWLVLLKHNEKKAQEDMVKVLGELFEFYNKVSNMPFYKFSKFIYKRFRTFHNIFRKK